MSNLTNTYEVTVQKSGLGLNFFFISKGKKDVVKAIQYSFVQKLDGKHIYNLGFGDYDLENDTIIDNVNSNNGDAYKVFNTVLSTIPKFFETHPLDILMVQGSDGSPEYEQECRLSCIKKCEAECKNYNRRINVYSGYVNRNFKQLSNEYTFMGGKRNSIREIVLETYLAQRQYDSVFVLKKTYTFEI